MKKKECKESGQKMLRKEMTKCKIGGERLPAMSLDKTDEKTSTNLKNLNKKVEILRKVNMNENSGNVSKRGKIKSTQGNGVPLKIFFF